MVGPGPGPSLPSVFATGGVWLEFVAVAVKLLEDTGLVIPGPDAARDGKFVSAAWANRFEMEFVGAEAEGGMAAALVVFGEEPWRATRFVPLPPGWVSPLAGKCGRSGIDR